MALIAEDIFVGAWEVFGTMCNQDPWAAECFGNLWNSRRKKSALWSNAYRLIKRELTGFMCWMRNWWRNIGWNCWTVERPDSLLESDAAAMDDPVAWNHTNHTIILEVGHKKKLDQKCLNSPRTPMAVPPIPAKPLAERLVLGAWYMAAYDIGADRIIRLKSLCRWAALQTL